MKIYHTATQEAYDELMIELEEKGLKWRSGEKPTDLERFKKYGKDTYIYDEYGGISFSDGYYFKAYCSDETLIEYKEKVEKMLNTECKKCHKKWHRDNAKYCSMCGNKLVDEPEFKVGDIVASKIFADGSFGLVRLNEDLTIRLTSVDGFWYIKRDCTVYDWSFGVIKEDTRHATPEEIAEYESALQFHKHGRNPFEVKQGDILSDSEYGKFFAGCEGADLELFDLFSKEDFISGRHTFLKTAEEVNEWLGIADE